MDEITRESFLGFNPPLQRELAEKFPDLKELLQEKKQEVNRKKPVPGPGLGVDFKEVNSALNIEEVCRYLGLEVKRHFCSCPFHNDKTPSMKLYKTNYKCFGCGASGDSIDLASKLLGVRPIEAVSSLNEAFHLGYNLKKQATHKQARTRKAEARKEDLYQEWYRAAVLLCSDYIRICYDVQGATTLEPWMIERGRTEAERVEALQDSIFETTPQKAYQLYREEVTTLEKRLNRGKRLAAGPGSKD